MLDSHGVSEPAPKPYAPQGRRSARRARKESDGRARHYAVIDRNGERGLTRTTPDELDGGAPATVELEGGRAVEVPASALVEHEAGSYLLRGDFADFAPPARAGEGRGLRQRACRPPPSSDVSCADKE